LLDEPESGIDQQGESDVFALIAELSHKEGLTAIIASHNLKQVSAYGQFTVLLGGLDRGVIAAGDTQKVLSEYI
jgi:ABC-type Mn2+/Zn2+ transport system ATPase subunit